MCKCKGFILGIKVWKSIIYSNVVFFFFYANTFYWLFSVRKYEYGFVHDQWSLCKKIVFVFSVIICRILKRIWTFLSLFVICILFISIRQTKKTLYLRVLFSSTTIYLKVLHVLIMKKFSKIHRIFILWKPNKRFNYIFQSKHAVLNVFYQFQTELVLMNWWILNIYWIFRFWISLDHKAKNMNF